MVIMAAADEAELTHMVTTAVHYNDGPIAFRYPRGEGVGVELPERGEVLEIGKGRVLREGSKVALLSLGTRLAETLKAADELESCGVSTTVADARFAKPIDRDLVRRLAASHEVLITIEEGSIGGFGAQVFQALSEDGLLDGAHGVFRFRSMTLPDCYIDEDSYDKMIAKAHLDAPSIVAKVLAVWRDPRRGESSDRVRRIARVPRGRGRPSVFSGIAPPRRQRRRERIETRRSPALVRRARRGLAGVAVVVVGRGRTLGRQQGRDGRSGDLMRDRLADSLPPCPCIARST